MREIQKEEKEEKSIFSKETILEKAVHMSYYYCVVSFRDVYIEGYFFCFVCIFTYSELEEYFVTYFIIFPSKNAPWLDGMDFVVKK